jgi:hypothetical protein
MDNRASGLYMIQGVSTDTKLASLKEFLIANKKPLLIAGGVLLTLFIISQNSK